MVWKVLSNYTTFVQTVTQFASKDIHWNMRNFWHSVLGFLISNWFIWLLFFFLFEQNKSTYTEHVHFIIVPLKILHRGYFKKKKKKGLQRQCGLHVSREPCALQLSHLGLCQCHMFSFWKWLFSENVRVDNITANRCKEGGDECVRIYCKKMEKSLGWLFMNNFSVSK